MNIASLALKSFRNRKLTTGLAITSITLSVSLLLAVEILRSEARTSFTNTVSGTDLIVGARSGPVQLLLYSVFRIGDPTQNIDWSSYEEISRLPGVKWSIPLSMGDSHRGFRVIGTDRNFFEHYRYARGRPLALRLGGWFEHAEDAVLGADVANRLGYRLGDEIVVAHGAGDESFVTHDDRPFRVSGILERTGTPVDRNLIISLEGFEQMHADWRSGGGEHSHDPLAHRAGALDAEREISAFLLGLDSRAAAIGMQRKINQFDAEPLSAILPGVALLQLWETVGLVEDSLLSISVLVVIVGLFSMLIILMTSMNERRREMAILRSVGARPGQVLALMLGEALCITLAGILLGIALVYGSIMLGQGWMAREFGLFIPLQWLSPGQIGILLLVALSGVIIGLIPGIRVYRYSLSDGISVRV